MSSRTRNGWTVARTFDASADGGERVTITAQYDGDTVTTEGVEDAAYVLAYVLAVDHGDDDFTNASTIALLFAGTRDRATLDAMETALESAWQGAYDANDDTHGTGPSLSATYAALLATRKEA